VSQPSLFDLPQPAPRPVSPVVREIHRRASNRDRVLARLQQGPATNVQLNDICFRYGARILELKREGFAIVKAHVGQSVWVYRLVTP